MTPPIHASGEKDSPTHDFKPPFTTTQPNSSATSRANSPPKDWTVLAAEKRLSNWAKIPPAWRVPSHLIPHFQDPSDPSTDTTTAPHADPATLPANVSVMHIPSISLILSRKELDITETYTATRLVASMRAGTLKCEDVVTAFCKRAAVAHQCTNCLTEIMFAEAMEKARILDTFYANNGGPAEGPIAALYGLPVSLKDSFNVAGVHTTIGYASFLARAAASQNSNLVAPLRDRGAIFYCKTNLPQTMMTADTHNNVFGRTLNPRNIALTAGGSTGGEGALLAMRGSVLGMTTDIAGSNRIPALCNGIKSFKPTAGRVPFGGGVPPGRLGSPSAIAPVIGPSGHSVEDFEMVLSTIIDAEPWRYDENVLAVPWRRVEPFSRPLRFAVIGGHAKRPLHPPVVRALGEASSALERAGHDKVEIDEGEIPDLWNSAVLAWKYFLLDPQKTAAKNIEASGEPLVPSLMTARFPELEGWEPSLDELFDMNVQKAKICRKWHDIMVEKELDFVLMPGYQGTAVPHDTYGVPIYTVLQNLLNYPSGILPFLNADKIRDQAFFNQAEQYEPPYEPEKVEGATTAVQIMGKPMKDEELIEVMKVVEQILEQAAESSSRDGGKATKAIDLAEVDMGSVPN